VESFEMWCWRRIEKINLTDHGRSEAVLQSRGRGISYKKYEIKRRKSFKG
jgi:hypothetical protein